MGIFISVQKTIECVVAAVVFAAALCLTYVKPLGILQSAGYGNKKLFSWAGRKGNQLINRQLLLILLCALAYGVIALGFSFAGEWSAVIGLAVFPLFFILYFIADRRIALRSPVSFTPRLKRLYVISFVVTGALVYLFITLLNFADFLFGNHIFNLLRYLPLALLPLLVLPIVAFSNLIAKIYEVPHNKSFVRKAKRKLEAASVTVIGITGSYGKTGTKQILSTILSKKFRVLSTPRSHNTPLGMALSINSNDLENYDIFIAEMGARHVGDIAELCSLCPPDYSAITGICPQHLESFKTEQNIIKAKGEILSATKKQAVIAADCLESFKEYPVEKQAADCVTDIVCTCEGTSFRLTLGGESVQVKTKLLGAHSARNIAIAAQLAHLLGMGVTEIAQAVKGLDYIEHRLQLIQSNGVNILDDGYNSNVKGAVAALEVLRTFGGRKIVVTPGLVELGILEESENYALGKNLVGLDNIILVGDTLITPVRNGYSENGGDMQNLSTVPTLFAAQEQLKGYLQSGDTVLFLNDLPDVYL